MLRTRLFTTATSLDLSGIITDETGTGALVFNTNPTIISPTINTSLVSNGFVQITDATASTSTTTGALTVAGGVGIGGALHVGTTATIGTSANINGISIYRPNSDSASTSVGYLAGAAATSGYIGNTAIGQQALRFNTSGANNTAVGAFALEGVTTGAIGSCTAVGWRTAGRNQASGTTAVGSAALGSNTLGTANVAMGRSALGAATTAIGTFTTTPVAAGSGYTANQTGVTVTLVKKSGANTFTGTVQAALTTDGSGAVTAVAATPVSAGSTFTGSNVIFEPSGFGAGSGCEISIATLASASSNTAVGHQAGLNLTTGGDNTIFGALAGDALTTGIKNVAIGANALGAGTTGNNNVAIGFGSIRNGVTTGVANVCIGTGTGQAISSGQYNVVIGGVQDGNYSPTGDRLTTGTGNILIGRANLAATNNTNCIAIIPGASIQPVDGDGSNTTVIGGTGTTQARIRGKTIGHQLSATTNAPIPALQALGQSTGTPAVGTGSALEFAALTTVGNTEIGAVIEAVATDVTSGSEDFDLVFKTMKNGAAPSASFTISNTAVSGQRAFHFQVDNTQNRCIDFRTASGRQFRTNLNDGSTGLPAFGVVSTNDWDITAGTGRFRCFTNGNFRVTNGNLIMGTAGTGIDFSADANAAGMTSELLDDYEEGTWTPVYEASTTPFTTMTMDVVSARYTKVGRLVTIDAHIRTDNVDATGATGSLHITGLPFTNSSATQSSVYIGHITHFATAPISGWIGGNGTYIRLVTRPAVNGNSGSAPVSCLTTGATADQNNLYFAALYYAT